MSDVDKSPRLDAEQVITSVTLGPGHDHRLLLAVEAAMNSEWWRGYRVGNALLPEMAEALRQCVKFIADAPALDFREDVTLSGIAVYSETLREILARYDAAVKS